MVDSQRYAAVVTQVLRRAAVDQPRLQSLRISAVCDAIAGQFLMIATGWEKGNWLNTILFHARLQDGKVIIEEDNVEAGLSGELIAAGILPEDLLSSEEPLQVDRAVA